MVLSTSICLEVRFSALLQIYVKAKYSVFGVPPHFRLRFIWFRSLKRTYRYTLQGDAISHTISQQQRVYYIRTSRNYISMMIVVVFVRNASTTIQSCEPQVQSQMLSIYVIN